MNLQNLDIKQNIQHHMFFVRVIGGVAYLKYAQPNSNILDYRETYVPPSSRNKGIASELVKHAMEYADHRDLKVVPSCPFVRNFIKKNPRYQKLSTKKTNIK